MISTVNLFNFYRRYRWKDEDFEELQESLYQYPLSLLSALANKAVLSGLAYSSDTGLDVSFSNGVAINEDGKLLVIDDDNNEDVTVTPSVNSLIVIRPVTTNTEAITRPVSPFDTVYLKSSQTAVVVAIAGTAGVYPSAAAGDVILFGVTADGSSITAVDHAQCELVGKTAPLNSVNPYNKLVGNDRSCHYRTLALALAAASAGDRIRVLTSEAVNTTIEAAVNNIEIVFDPGVAITQGTAGTGLLLSGDGIVVRGGRFDGFDGGSDIAISITGDYCSIMGSRFGTNDTDISDTNETSQYVGVINE